MYSRVRAGDLKSVLFSLAMCGPSFHLHPLEKKDHGLYVSYYTDEPHYAGADVHTDETRSALLTGPAEGRS